MMDPIKLEQFQILNQLSINSDSITCSSCKSWLTSQIYIHADNDIANYCQPCAMLKTEAQRYEFLENVVQDLLFPCKYADCDFILKGYAFDDHVNNCIYAPNECNLCNKNDMNLTELVDHLKADHADKTIGLEKPILKRTFNKATKNEILIATLHQHIFLIHIKLIESKLSVNVARVGNICDNIKNHFTVCCRNDDIERIFKKRFIMFSSVSMKSCHNADILVEVDEPVDLEIFFCDYEKALQFAECPICKYDLGLEVYQCVNGHNECQSCGAKLIACAICRSTDRKLVKLRCLFPNAQILCPYFDAGCLAVSKGDDVVTHAKLCIYSSIDCLVCAEQVYQFNIITHMRMKHKLYKNMEIVYISSTSAENISYVSFKKNMFVFKCTISGTGNTEKVSYLVQALHVENIAEAQKYKYEIHITDKDHKESIHILTGLCQTIDNNDTSSWIYYNTCVELFEIYKEVEILNYRCVIVELEDSNSRQNRVF